MRLGACLKAKRPPTRPEPAPRQPPRRTRKEGPTRHNSRRWQRRKKPAGRQASQELENVKSAAKEKADKVARLTEALAKAEANAVKTNDTFAASEKSLADLQGLGGKIAPARTEANALIPKLKAGRGRRRKRRRPQDRRRQGRRRAGAKAKASAEARRPDDWPPISWKSPASGRGRLFLKRLLRPSRNWAASNRSWDQIHRLNQVGPRPRSKDNTNHGLPRPRKGHNETGPRPHRKLPQQRRRRAEAVAPATTAAEHGPGPTWRRAGIPRAKPRVIEQAISRVAEVPRDKGLGRRRRQGQATLDALTAHPRTPNMTPRPSRSR